MSRRLILLTVLAGLIALPALSAAHTKRYGAQLTIRFTPATQDYTGKLTSGDGCQRNRQVKVFRTTDADQLVGSDRTDAAGRWTIHSGEAFDLHGRYEARIARAVKRPGEHKHICLGVRAAMTR